MAPEYAVSVPHPPSPAVKRPEPAEHAVVVDGVSHAYGGVEALRDLSWHAPAGAITALLGRNGAGKTSVVEMAEGLRRPASGSIRVLGAEPWNADAAHRARVGVMLQDGGLPMGTKPLALLRHLASFYAEPRDIDELAGALDIPTFNRTSVRRLSGGQRQRVALAAAMIGRPEVLFLDEPSAGLDPHARRDVWDLVEAERERGASVVVTTHSFEEAERLAAHVVVMNEGRCVAQGSLADVTDGRSLEDVYFDLTGKGTP